MKGLKHDLGKITLKNGTEYIGYFEDGKKNGLGQYKWGTGSIYQGIFLDDKPHEGGKMNWQPDDTTYEGEWKNGIAHGQGRKTNSDKSQQTGNFVEGKMA